MTCHSVRTPDRPSIICLDDVDFRPDTPLYREASVPACNPSGRLSSPPERRPVIDQLQIFFPSSNKGSLMQPFGQRGSRPDALIHKARITNSNTTVRTSVNMVRTRVQQIWKLRVEDQPSGRSSPMVWTREALYGNYLQLTCDRLDDSASPSGRGSQTGKIFSENLEIFCRTVVRLDSPCPSSGRHPYLSQ